jgi:hypothetical protein
MDCSTQLDLKPFEVLTATDVFTCASCGRTVPRGSICIQINEVTVEHNQFTVKTRLECLHRCSTVRREREQMQAPQRPRIIRPEWDDCPDAATAAQRAHFPITNFRDERIANGYNAIIELAEEKVFLECEDPQVVTRLFVIDPTFQDCYGRSVQMKTPSGFYGRRFLDDKPPFRKDCWYFALHLVKPVGIQVAAGGAR